MSKTTLRKRIALTVSTALLSGVLSFVATPSANAALSSTNLAIADQATAAATANYLLVAEQNSTTGSRVMPTWGVAAAGAAARSLGILSKDTSTGTAQSATVLAGGALVLYTQAVTDVAFTATGGTFSNAFGATNSSGYYSSTVRNVFVDMSTGANITATGVALTWNAPSTPGTYTVSMDVSASTTQLADGDYSGTLAAAITVTVVASSAGGSYSAAYSLCNTRSNSDGVGVATGIDSTTALENGHTAYIAFDLDDAYDTSLDAGALIISATNGALVALGTSSGAVAAGTTSTVVSTVAPTNQVAQITQGTANAPVTTTVTITFNGTTVCTKTITIRGEVASLVVSDVGTEDLSNSSSPGSAYWIADGTNRVGSFRVLAKDSAGNTVKPTASTAFSADSATLTPTVQAITISSANVATSVSSSTLAWNYSVGTFTCGSTAGESSVKLKYTNTGSGTVITSPAFTARCADNPYTYTASFDKASYVQGEIATLTVQFLDSKGNKANTTTAIGALTATHPMMTMVSGLGDSTSVAAKADGTRTYTLTVGTTSGITAGSYTSIIDFTSLTAVAATKATPTYKVSTGADTTTNADVLKSIVALIASINKQIQALQKLILKK